MDTQVTPQQTKVIEVEKNFGGWGLMFNPDTSRPFAVRVNGEILRTKSGAVRTFSTRKLASKAGEKA